jgi:hypothetical protein
MRARSHSGRRARAGIPADGAADEFDETGVGMDAAAGVAGVSGINSAMEQNLSTGRPKGAPERYKSHIPAPTSVPYSRCSTQIVRGGIIRTPTNRDEHRLRNLVYAFIRARPHPISRIASINLLPDQLQTPRQMPPPPAARPRRAAVRCRAAALASSRPCRQSRTG